MKLSDIAASSTKTQQEINLEWIEKYLSVYVANQSNDNNEFYVSRAKLRDLVLNNDPETINFSNLGILTRVNKDNVPPPFKIGLVTNVTISNNWNIDWDGCEIENMLSVDIHRLKKPLEVLNHFKNAKIKKWTHIVCEAESSSDFLKTILTLDSMCPGYDLRFEHLDEQLKCYVTLSVFFLRNKLILNASMKDTFGLGLKSSKEEVTLDSIMDLQEWLFDHKLENYM